MKTRRILAASTAALLSFASVAVVASATATSVEIDCTGEWESIIAGVAGTNPGVSYKASTKDKKSLADLKISADNTTSAATAVITPATSSAPAASGTLNTVAGFKDLKAKALTGIAQKLSVWDDASSAAVEKAAVFDIGVTTADDEDFVPREDFVLGAKIGISIDNLEFAADHVYHIEGSKLVEVKATNLTKKKVTVSSVETTYYGIEFESKSFSPFIVSEGAIKGAVALDDEENPANDSDAATSDDTSSKADGTTSPDTGIALAIAPVVLAAGAVAVVALKKKH